MGRNFGDHIVGLLFSDVPLNGANYLESLDNTIEPNITEIVENDDDQSMFQHDSPPAHYAASVREFLNERFSDLLERCNGGSS